MKEYVYMQGRDLERQTTVPFPNSWLRVSAGWLHTCGIHSDRSIECWGANDSGQCDVPFEAGVCRGGEQDGQVCSTHAACTGGGQCDGEKKRDWDQVSCGQLHTCAIDRSNRVFCWGSNQYGQAAIKGAVTTKTGTGGHGQDVVDSRGFMTSPCL